MDRFLWSIYHRLQATANRLSGAMWAIFSDRYQRFGDRDKVGQAWCAPDVPSGALKDPAPPKTWHICHQTQTFDAKITRNIGWIRNHMVMVDAGGISRNRASVWKIEAGFEGIEKGHCQTNGWSIRASIWRNRPNNTNLGKVPSGVLPGFEHKWWILGQWKNESFPLDSGFFRLILNLMNKCR
jgi:hypothetical protein